MGFIATALFCVPSYLWLDRPVALWWKASLAGFWQHVFKTITDLGLSQIYLVPAGLLWLAFFALERRQPGRWQVRRNAAAFVFASVAASGLFVDAVKGLAGRYRPRELFDHGLYGFDPFTAHWAMNSFPSGHGQTAFAAMTALMVIVPRLRWLWLAIAVLVAASRVITSVHYLSDVAMGSYLGIAGTVLLRRWFEARGWALRREGGGWPH